MISCICWTSCHDEIWVGMQELTKSTHEDKEIQSIKYSCSGGSVAFEEDCSPAGSPRPLLAKLLGKRPFRIGHSSYVATHAELAKNYLYAFCKLHRMLTPLLLLGNRFGRSSQKSDQIFKLLYSHPRWRSAPKPRFWSINMKPKPRFWSIVRSELHHPWPPCSTDLACNGWLLLGLAP